MSLFRRIADILSANVHDLTDRFEDPEKMLCEAIRQLEAAIDDARRRSAKVIASGRLAATERAAQQTHAERWRRQADRAVQRGDDEAARHALRQERQINKVVAALHDQVEATQTQATKLRRKIDALQVKLAEARRVHLEVRAKHQAAQAKKTLEARSLVNRFGTTVRVDRILQRVEMAEAEADALEELCDERNSLSPEDDDPEIDAELERMKTSAVRTP